MSFSLNLSGHFKADAENTAADKEAALLESLETIVADIRAAGDSVAGSFSGAHRTSSFPAG